MTAEIAVRSPAAFRLSAAPRAGLLRGRKARMTTQFNRDCPAMKPGDEVADTENLAIEGWACDCIN